jgi:hypothetical protein
MYTYIPQTHTHIHRYDAHKYSISLFHEYASVTGGLCEGTSVLVALLIGVNLIQEPQLRITLRRLGLD